MEKGDRVRLASTNDRYTDLKPGDEGTVTSIDTLPASIGGQKQIWINWDKGSRLALVEGRDEFIVVDRR